MDRQQRLKAALSPSQPDRHRVISVLSGKGGVGKSVIAYNLAERAKDYGLRTLLVDADLSSGNIHVLANLAPEHNLWEYAVERLSLKDTVVTTSSGLEILAAPSAGTVVETLDTRTTAKLFARLYDQTRDYDLIVIDHSSGVSKSATVLASASDLCLLIVIPELTSIHDGYGLWKYLFESNTSIDCRLLLNRVNSEEETRYVRSRFTEVAEKFLGKAPGFIGSLPEDEAVRQAVARQVPIAGAVSQSPVVQVLDAFIQVYAGRSTQPVSANPSKTVNNHPATADIRE
ncbi:MAG: hypothetical protein DRP45_05315 [Candidatus Zixiibacteriota bacterium]|nr:MAG: hypothetical protein DRP45_05315 [candidate division Zixibacteria bacterium]